MANAGYAARQSGSMLRNRWLRILGVAFVMYVLSYIDRVNIAMASAGDPRRAGAEPSDDGACRGVLPMGLHHPADPDGPACRSVERQARHCHPARELWSAVALSTAFVNSEAALIVNRFALGLAEGGVLTCTIVLIRAWFTRAERARANTLFLMSLAIGPVIANPVSGLVLHFTSWRAMFVIEALPALLWGLVWWWAVEDNPRDAAWLDPVERARLVAALDAERAAVAPPSGHWLTTLWHPAVLLLAFYNFAALTAEYGVNFWLPTVLKDTGLSILAVGFLSAIPYAVGAVAMLLVAWSSDRRGERKWHMIAATAGSGVLLIVASLVPQGSTLAILCCLTLSVGAFLGRFGPFWTLPSEILPVAVAGVGIGLINGAGNLGGTVGPYFFGVLKSATGSFSLALLLGGVSLIIGALIAAPIRLSQRG